MGANLGKALDVNVMQLSLITQCIWLLCTVACWDLIARVSTHRGTCLIFSPVHRHFTLYSMCLDYNYRLYLCLIRWHGTTGGWWVLTVGCNYVVWGTWLLACTKEIVAVLRTATKRKYDSKPCVAIMITQKKKKTCQLFQINLWSVSCVRGWLLPWWAAHWGSTRQHLEEGSSRRSSTICIQTYLGLRFSPSEREIENVKAPAW